MKKQTCLLIACALAMSTNAHEYYPFFLEDAMALGFALNVPNASTSTVWIKPLFGAYDSVTTNAIKLIKTEESPDQPIKFSVSTNEQTIANGTLLECSTFENARTELLLSLTINNLMLEARVARCNVQTNVVGDFSIREVKSVDSTGVKTYDPSILHFVRGAKAVSLFGKDGADVRPIAEVLDELLKNPPAGQQ